jgi:DoxX-like family
MAMNSKAASRNTTRLWAGWIMSGVVLLFLLFDGVTKLILIAPVVEATREIGYPEHLVRPIGVVVLICAVLYFIPRTAILGAILLTGLLGGAIASKMRVEDPLFSSVLFGVYVGALAWGGLYLREGRLRALIPLAMADKSQTGK